MIGRFSSPFAGIIEMALRLTNRSKSPLASMVNRVLTSPYLWWFDPPPRASPKRGDRRLSNVLAL
jgi:hypothetical protein